tara:strand:+ start:270 stop:533 length:264 start_codon:yes stop_codon:yes gene_type:complete
MPIINIPNTYVLIIDIKKDDEFKKRKFIVNSFTPEKADKLFFDKIYYEGEAKIDRFSDSYNHDLYSYIKMNKLVLNPTLEYLLDFSF